MTLPLSFARDGFLSPDKLRAAQKYRRLMIGTEGLPNTGKSEFAISAPGPGLALCLDRGYEAMLDNKTPPPTRNSNWAFKVIPVPLETSATQAQFLDYWRAFYAEYSKALANVEARSILLDGDSDSWELQRLAEFGKLQQIPSILYTRVNCGRRAMIAKAYDSGKIIIATNKVKKSYRTTYDAMGKVMTDNTGKEVREWDGGYERQGFSDHEYLWQIQLRHLYDKAKGFGIRILMCKADKSLEGYELWGEYCNFQSLVETVYPDVPLKEWGF